VAGAAGADGSTEPTLQAWAAASGLRARIGVPLYAGGRVVGALLIASTTPGRSADGLGTRGIDPAPPAIPRPCTREGLP
jgi:GAF domain-containing protein